MKKLLQLSFVFILLFVIEIPAIMAGRPFQISADEAIVGVTTIGYTTFDGTKLSAIVVEYNVDLTGSDVSADSYEIEVYVPSSLDNVVNYGDEDIGDITKVYVNSEPDILSETKKRKGKPVFSQKHSKEENKFVIIEVYTDYVLASEPSYLKSLAAGVTQIAAISGKKGIVTPGTEQVCNFESSEESSYDGTVTTVNYAIDGTYTVQGLEDYKLFTNDPGVFGADGPAYTAYNTFSEKTGEYYDYDMGYALYVPEDYKPNKKYALVTVDHTISSGSHPYEALLTNYGPTYFISDEAQQRVKDIHGLDGLIVVVPLIIERVDDNQCVPGMWMALLELWDYLQEEYSISKDHIYGAGQSMGGMLLMEANTKRDNYFAGLLMYGNQWGQNYYKDTVYARGMSSDGYEETAETTPRHYPSTADTRYIWDYHWGDNGEKVYDGHDFNNFYYLISDDNLMVFNGSTNYLSNDIWLEQSTLYQDLVGYSIPRLTGLDGFADVEDQNQAVRDFLAQGNAYGESEMGLYRCTWEGGANDATAIWSRRMTAGYEWLLSQSRETEMVRPKLDLNKPFELADTQIQDDSRLVVGFYDKYSGEDLYLLTGKEGAGTQFYNTSWLQAGNSVPADGNPGRLPEGMSYPIEKATIQDVTALDDGGTLVAVALQYDVNMEDAVIHIIGDNVIDSWGTPRDDDFVTIDPFDFYDADGDKITATITNVYINSEAAVVPWATRGSGAGNFVIVEIETDTNWNAGSVGVIQRTTVRTNEAISAASSKLYE